MLAGRILGRDLRRRLIRAPDIDRPVAGPRGYLSDGARGCVFHDAGWSKLQLKRELETLLQIPVAELLRGANGIEAGILPNEAPDPRGTLPKFRTGSLNIVRAGGSAGKFSAYISGLGSITINPVTKEITP